MICKICGIHWHSAKESACGLCLGNRQRKQKAINAFRYHYRNADVYLSWKIIAGKRMKLSLTEIAKALSVPITDVENAWYTLQQDAR